IYCVSVTLLILIVVFRSPIPVYPYPTVVRVFPMPFHPYFITVRRSLGRRIRGRGVIIIGARSVLQRIGIRIIVLVIVVRILVVVLLRLLLLLLNIRVARTITIRVCRLIIRNVVVNGRISIRRIIAIAVAIIRPAVAVIGPTPA